MDPLMDSLVAHLVKIIFPTVLMQFKFPGRKRVNLSHQKRCLWIPSSSKRVNALTPDSEFCSSSSQLNTSVCELKFYCELEFSTRMTELNYNIKLNR